MYSQIGDYKARIDSLQDQLTDARSDLEAAEQQQSATAEAYQQLQTSLEHTHSEAQQELATARQLLIKVEQQLHSDAAQHDQQIESKDAEVAQHAQRAAELESSLKEAEAARGQLEEEYGYALQEAGQREEALRQELATIQVLCKAVVAKKICCQYVLDNQQRSEPLCMSLHASNQLWHFFHERLEITQEIYDYANHAAHCTKTAPCLIEAKGNHDNLCYGKICCRGLQSRLENTCPLTLCHLAILNSVTACFAALQSVDFVDSLCMLHSAMVRKQCHAQSIVMCM